MGHNRLSPTEKSNSLHRRLLQESSNLQAAAPTRAFNQRTVIVSSTGSGSFPALTSASGSNKEIPNEQLAYDNRQGMSSRPDPMSGMSDGSYENQSRESARSWASVLMIPGAALFFTLLAAMLVMLRSQENSAFSGTVQKAFVTGKFFWSIYLSISTLLSIHVDFLVYLSLSVFISRLSPSILYPSMHS